MNFRTDDQLFANYEGQYIEMFVNGIRKKFFVEKTNSFALLSSTTLFDPNLYDYSFIKVSDEQECGNKCITEGITIRVIYSGNPTYQGITNPCPQPHNCNASRYLFYANGLFLGDVNLDNYPSGGERESSFVLSTSEAEDIALIDEKKITFQLICNVAGNPKKGVNGSLGPGICHESIPWVHITSKSGAVLYSGCPSQNEFNIELMCS
jgi:hypothetical protein